MQAIQNFFYNKPTEEPPAPMATKPMHVSSEKELLEHVAKRIDAALVNQEMFLMFLPESQEHTSYVARFGYHEHGAVKLPVLSHSFIISTKNPVEQHVSNSCNRSQEVNEGKAFYNTEGTTQKWLSHATVDKIDSMIRAKLNEMNPNLEFSSKEEISKALDLKMQELENQFKNIRKTLLKDPLFTPAPRRYWMI